MLSTLTPLAYLLFSWTVITSILAALIVYARIVSTQDDRFHFKKLEDERVADQERVIIEKLKRLNRRIIPLAVVSGVLLLATAVVWVWSGLKT